VANRRRWLRLYDTDPRKEQPMKMTTHVAIVAGLLGSLGCGTA
jgi:hypothetical protein